MDKEYENAIEKLVADGDKRSKHSKNIYKDRKKRPEVGKYDPVTGLENPNYIENPDEGVQSENNQEMIQDGTAENINNGRFGENFKEQTDTQTDTQANKDKKIHVPEYMNAGKPNAYHTIVVPLEQEPKQPKKQLPAKKPNLIKRTLISLGLISSAVVSFVAGFFTNKKLNDMQPPQAQTDVNKVSENTFTVKYNEPDDKAEKKGIVFDIDGNTRYVSDVGDLVGIIDDSRQSQKDAEEIINNIKNSDDALKFMKTMYININKYDKEQITTDNIEIYYTTLEGYSFTEGPNGMNFKIDADKPKTPTIKITVNPDGKDSTTTRYIKLPGRNYLETKGDRVVETAIEIQYALNVYENLIHGFFNKDITAPKRESYLNEAIASMKEFLNNYKQDKYSELIDSLTGVSTDINVDNVKSARTDFVNSMNVEIDSKAILQDDGSAVVYPKETDDGRDE